jgi:hypothetical protein
MKRTISVVAALAVLAVTACHRQHTPAIAHRAVGEDNQALREAFNADIDKVRVIMLVAPS